jgi:hypothetical protein
MPQHLAKNATFITFAEYAEEQQTKAAAEDD